MQFTKDAVSALTVPRGKSEIIVFDDDLPGFGIRIRETGSRTWIVQYQIGAKQRRVSLGSVSGQPLAKARRSAGDLLARVRLGDDPQADKFKARAVAGETLGKVVERFIEQKRKTLRPRTLAEVERHLGTHWKPLHGVQVSRIDRAMVAGRLSELRSENGDYAADHARTALSTFFQWAAKEGLVETNPVAATNRPAEPIARDRVLTDDELRLVWNACRDDDYGRIVKLLMLTGQRREEISALTWPEIDRDKAVLSLPASRTKNGRPHDVPLSDLALSVLPSQRGDRDFVFGESSGAFSGFSAAKRRMDDRIAAARVAKSAKAKAMAPWRLHDLRRTVATRLSDLGVPPHVVEALLNHVSGFRAGVAGTYNRAVYAQEKRAALVLWAEHIRSLVGPSNVVPLRREASA